MIYLGVDKQYDLPHHNIYFSKDYEGNVKDIFNNNKISDEPSFYLQNASVTDPTLAPPGKSTIYILVPMPNNTSGIDWIKEKDPFKEKMLDLVVARTPMKDLENTYRDGEDHHSGRLGTGTQHLLWCYLQPGP